METSRPIGLDDPTAVSMTVRQVAARFHVEDVVWSCSLAWGLLGDQTDATWSPHLASEDGGFADSWGSTGTYLVGTDHLSVQFDPHQAGGFRGSYTFTLLASWPMTSTTISVASYDTRLEGMLVESTRRSTGPNSGEGFVVKSAVWQCGQSTPIAP